MAFSRLQSKICRASALAAIAAPLTSIAAQAKDLTAADLASMSQASAVRIGCGVTVGLPVDASPAEVTSTFTGVLIACGLLSTGLRFLPKPLRDRAWKLHCTTAGVYFWAGLPLAIAISNGLDRAAGNIAFALWLYSCLYAIPAMLVSSVRNIYKMLGLLQQRLNNIYVRVDGDVVTLRHGFHKKSRAVSSDVALQEEETCLTR